MPHLPALIKQLLCVVGVTVGLMLGCAGCTAWATYPPIEGAAGINRPGLSPIPELMAEAIWYAYDTDGAPGELIINLPPETPSHVYDRVIARIGDGRPMLSSDEDAYCVTAVRVRTIEAEVDVVRPGNSGPPQLVTISFEQTISGHRVKNARVRRFAVDMPAPSYPAVAEDGAGGGEGAMAEQPGAYPADQEP